LLLLQRLIVVHLSILVANLILAALRSDRDSSPSDEPSVLREIAAINANLKFA
jgi:hypothetical protein